MDFFRTRTLTYMIGAAEFAENIRLNILDTVFPSFHKTRDHSSWNQLNGKVVYLKFLRASPECPYRSKSNKCMIVKLSLQTCIITGGNAGIGLATADAIAKQGGHVILACRSLERGQLAAKVSQLI